MAAIITPKFRKNNAAVFKAALVSETTYLGLGRSQPWTSDTSPTLPTGSELEVIQGKTSLIQMKKIVDTIDAVSGYTSRMIPRVDWISGRKYFAYAIGDITCLYSSISGATTIYPCYCINANKVYLCKTAGSGGVSVAPTHSSGDSSSDGGYVWTYLTSLSSNASLNLTNFVAISDSDTLEKLPSWYVGIAVNIASDDFFKGTTYRQISVIKNTGSTDSLVTSCRYFQFATTLPSSPAIGSIITQASNTSAKGVVVSVDTTNKRIYFSDTADNGTVTAFNTSGQLSFGGTPYPSPPTISSINQGSHTRTSNIPNGDIVFLENRQPITHVDGQVEEVRVVIQF